MIQFWVVIFQSQLVGAFEALPKREWPICSGWPSARNAEIINHVRDLLIC